MSRDIEDTLEAVNINVIIHVGYINASCGHMWIEIFGIEFDSVGLMPKSYDLKYNKWHITYNDYEDWVNKYGK